MDSTVELAGLIVALVLGIVAVIQSRGSDLTAWGVAIGFGVLVLSRVA